MRLHRLRLKDFRGIEERDIEFATSGVTVVEGANEAGKSSMIEALDLLLETQASSKSAAVKSVQPAGRDVGSEVSAEISCGPWHFVYFKRFNKRTETSLKILEPRRQELTGREAHEKVRQILASELDDGLFRALRLLQSGGPDLAGLADSPALARALDRVAAPTEAEGADAGDEGAALIELATAEYRRYYTATGRPTGELAAARAAAKDARSDVDERAAAMNAAQQAAAELPEIEAACEQTVRDETHAAEELADLGRRVAEAEKVRAALAEARARAEQRAGAAGIAERDRDERNRTAAELAEREQRIAADTELAGEMANAAKEAEAKALELEAAAEQARGMQQELRAELAAAEAVEQVRADQAALDRVDAVTAELAELTTQRTVLSAQIEANPVLAEHVSEAEDIERQLLAARAGIDAVAATVEVSIVGAGEVRLDGTAITETTVVPALAETVIETADARVTVRCAEQTQKLASDVAGLAERARELAERCGVADIAEIAPRAATRAEQARALARIDEDVRRVLGGRTVDELRMQREQLVARIPGDQPAPGRPVAELRIEERRISDLITQAAGTAAAQRNTAGQLRARAEAKAQTVESERAAAAGSRTELLERRAKVSDAALAALVEAARHEHEQALAVVAERTAQAAGADAGGAAAAYAEAEQNRDRIATRLRGLRERRTELRTMLEMSRTENRLDQLADAQKAAKAAEDELARVTERAAGAEMLYETLVRTRDESRSRYVAPLTRRLEELAAPVFGDSVRFEVADDFTIANRTLDGTTVDVQSLSGGAREQLGLIARLACAMIVDEVDGVPVILDDALGYSDPERLASMTRVLAEAAGDAQIIVLTCTPDRYAALDGATVVAV